jgi:hypothetical protein
LASIIKAEAELTILFGCTTKKFSYKVLRWVSVWYIFHEPQHMRNYLFIAEILIQSIRRQYKKPIICAETMVKYSRVAADIW